VHRAGAEAQSSRPVRVVHLALVEIVAGLGEQVSIGSWVCAYEVGGDQAAYGAVARYRSEHPGVGDRPLLFTQTTYGGSLAWVVSYCQASRSGVVGEHQACG